MPENDFDDEGEDSGLLDDTGRGDEQRSSVLPLKSLGQNELPFFAPCLMVHYEYKSNHLQEQWTGESGKKFDSDNVIT